MWRKEVGEPVHRGDVLFEIETDKSSMEVEAFDDGVLLAQLVPAGAEVPVNEICAYVGEPGEAIPDAPAAVAAPAPAMTPTPAAPSAAPSAAIPTPPVSVVPAPAASASSEAAGAGTARLRVSPRASGLASTAGLDLTTVTGTGPGGRIVESDVVAAIAARGAAPSAPDGTTAPGGDADAELPAQPMSRMRRVIAERLTTSWTTVPQFTVTVAVDVSALVARRTQLKAAGTDVTITDLVLEATARTLAEFPDVNARTDGVSVWPRPRIHLGVAVSVPAGLVVPVLRDADRLTIREIHERTATFAAAARDGTLAIDDMTGSTFTVSNLGMFGVEEFSAIINPGESAILAVSSAIPTPVADAGAVAIRPIMKLTLTADHRIVDGATAARFLAALRARIEASTSVAAGDATSAGSSASSASSASAGSAGPVPSPRRPRAEHGPDSFDLVVLGAGTGGYSAAFRAAQLGLKVALVDEDRIGGTCLHRGCIPTKAILESADLAHRAREGGAMGIEVGGVTVDYANVARRKDEVVQRMWTGLKTLVTKNGVEWVAGRGRLEGPGRVRVRLATSDIQPDATAERVLEATDVVVATGSRVKSLAGIVPDGRRTSTSDDVLALTTLPASIVIVGAGAVGAEFASALHDLGVAVTLLEYLPALVPLEDRDVSKELERSFRRRGISVITSARFDPASLVVGDDGIRLTVGPDGGAATEIAAECLLVATGRAANVEDVGLEYHPGRRPERDRRGRRPPPDGRAACLGDRRRRRRPVARPHGGPRGPHGRPHDRGRDRSANRLRRPAAGDLHPARDRLDRPDRGAMRGARPRDEDRQGPVPRHRQGRDRRRARRIRQGDRRRPDRGDPRRPHRRPPRDRPDRGGLARHDARGNGRRDRSDDARPSDPLRGPRRGGDGRRRAVPELLRRSRTGRGAAIPAAPLSPTPGSPSASWRGSGGAACGAPSPRSGGSARGSRRTRGRPPRASGLRPSSRPNRSCEHLAARAPVERVEHVLDLLLEQLVRRRVGRGERAASSTKSPRWLSSSSPIGVSSDTGSCDDLDDLAHLLRGDLDSGPWTSPRRSPRRVGSRPSSCSSRRETRISLLIVSTMWTGMRIVRAWSAIARVIAWRIHHVAYVENLKPFVVVELLDRPDQADVAFLDQVEQRHAAADVLLGDRHDQPQVRLGQLLASVAPDPDELALAVGQLRVERDLGVEAHPLEEVRVVAGGDPALEGRKRDVVAGPVVDRSQADVVARVEIAVVDGEVGPVEERQERVGLELLGVGRHELLRLLQEVLRPVRLGVASGLHEVEVRRARRAGPRPASRSASWTSRWASSPSGRRCCGFVDRVFRSVSWRVHSWSETMPFHGASTSCSPSSIALARTTSSSAVSRATLPISLRYIRTGSSIPIMSALIASSSSAVGSSSSAASSLAGASIGSFVVDRDAVLADDLDSDVASVRAREPIRARLGPELEAVVVLVVVVRDLRQDDLGRPQVAGRQARLLDVGLGPPRPGQHGLDQLLIERIGHGVPSEMRG